jgi:SPP1 gp7 family putative phage head morphogenesis protein
MPVQLPAPLRVGLIEPNDAAAAFAKRGLLLPSFRWQEVWEAEHARAFTVAGVMRLDILELFRAELDKAVATGSSLEAFRKTMMPALVAKGFWGDVEITNPVTGELRTTRFNARRLRTIFDVNMRQSFAAGRWARIEQTKERLPFVTYRTMRDERVRASHADWDGTTLPVDHEFWDTHYPPCGWSCRCTAFAVDERGIAKLKAAGVTVKRGPPPKRLVPWVNNASGRLEYTPEGIDPGFAYNPGKVRDAGLFDVAAAKAARAPAEEASAVVWQAALEHPTLVAEKAKAFDGWVREVVRSENARREAVRLQQRGAALQAPPNELRFVGVIHPWVVRALRERNLPLQSAVIATTRDDVIHMFVDKVADQVVPLEILVRLPLLLQQPTAVLLDTTRDKQDVLYVFDVQQSDGRRMKLVLLLNRSRFEGRRSTRKIITANMVRTVALLEPRTFLNTGYELLWGSL